MKRLLLLTDWFAPGYRAGGPITSCVNLCQGLNQDLSVFVLTGDRDFGASSPYEGVIPDNWQAFGSNIQVYYCSSQKQSYRTIRQLIQDVGPDAIYLNGMFSRVFTVYPLLMLYLGQLRAKIVLAPRGMLRSSALRFKAWKKQVFLALFKFLKLQEKVYFHATDKEEAQSIIKVFGSGLKLAQIEQIPNFPSLPVSGQRLTEAAILPGSFLFIGRIHPIKGLLLALQVLQTIQAPVIFTIAGPIEDTSYWERCRQLISQLPEHIKVRYWGEQPPPAVKRLLAEHAFLLLPTQGENFGHAIFEAFAAGRPAIISDQTPWRNLQEKGIGWDVDITQTEPLERTLHAALELDEEEYQRMCRASHQFAVDFIKKNRLKERYRALFSTPEFSS